jgi:hypothetical protein
MIEWRDVVAWNGLYRVSSAGDVMSPERVIVRIGGNTGRPQRVRRRARVLKPILCNGYWRVELKGEGRSKKVYIHHLVCEAWHGQRPDGHEVAHGDNDRTNNDPDNLRWATRLDNIRDKAAHGTQPMGERVYNASLTDEQAREVKFSGRTRQEMARKCGVSLSVIAAIREGKNYKHIQRLSL